MTYMVAVPRTGGAPFSWRTARQLLLPCCPGVLPVVGCAARVAVAAKRTQYNMGVGVGAVGSFKPHGAWETGAKIRHDNG